MKIVINCDYGGFSLSDLAIETYADRKGIKLKKEKTTFGITLYTNVDTNEDFESRDIERNDSVLIKVVEDPKSRRRRHLAASASRFVLLHARRKARLPLERSLCHLRVTIVAAHLLAGFLQGFQHDQIGRRGRSVILWHICKK